MSNNRISYWKTLNIGQIAMHESLPLNRLMKKLQEIFEFLPDLRTGQNNRIYFFKDTIDDRKYN